jgi:TIR domain
MLTCPKCSYPIDKKTKFCLYCDAPVEVYVRSTTNPSSVVVSDTTSNPIQERDRTKSNDIASTRAHSVRSHSRADHSVSNSRNIASTRTRDSKPQPANDSDTAAAIFISYRREDSSDVTGRIYDRLTAHFGKDTVFKDVDSIPLGVDFRKHLGDSVGRCDVLLTIIGKQWLVADESQRRLDDVRDFVRIEIEAALQRDIPVIPVLVQGASVPKPADLPETLQSLVYRNGIACRPDPDFHSDMDRLIRGIEGCLKRKTHR